MGVAAGFAEGSARWRLAHQVLSPPFHQSARLSKISCPGNPGRSGGFRVKVKCTRARVSSTNRKSTSSDSPVMAIAVHSLLYNARGASSRASSFSKYVARSPDNWLHGSKNTRNWPCCFVFPAWLISPPYPRIEKRPFIPSINQTHQPEICAGSEPSLRPGKSHQRPQALSRPFSEGSEPGRLAFAGW